MRFLRVLVLTVFALGTLAAFQAMAKQEDAKKTGKNCAYCHVKGNPKTLTEAGKYYKEKKTLEGFKEPEAKK